MFPKKCYPALAAYPAWLFHASLLEACCLRCLCKLKVMVACQMLKISTTLHPGNEQKGIVEDLWLHCILIVMGPHWEDWSLGGVFIDCAKWWFNSASSAVFMRTSFLTNCTRLSCRLTPCGTTCLSEVTARWLGILKDDSGIPFFRTSLSAITFTKCFSHILVVQIVAIPFVTWKIELVLVRRCDI